MALRAHGFGFKAGVSRFNETVRRHCRAGSVAVSLTLATGQASAIDLGIENDAEYATLVSAMRAAEYVRSDAIVSTTPKPRVYAVLAGVMAYAERNPNATDELLGAFLVAFDAACREFSAGDPDLNERASLYAALRFAVVDDHAFAGTDTRIGLRALELIGVTIPNPDGYLAIQDRMVEFEVSLGRSLDYGSGVFDLLVTGFFGQDPAGRDRPGLPAILDAYFESEGFDPELGGTRPDLPQVDAGLALLPAGYDAYRAAIEAGAQNDALRSVVEAQLDSVRDRITAIVGVDDTIDDGSLDAALAADPGLVGSLERSLTDPAYVNGVLDDLRARLEATAQARAAASSATFLMLQSDDSTIEAYASFTRDYSQIALETNEQMAQVESGVKIATSLALVAGGAYFGNPEITVGALVSLGSLTLDLALDQNAAPSVEEQTFQQLVELRQQVEQFRQEMNFRFDRIDRQLNNMTDAIQDGFIAIGNGIGQLQGDVDVLVYDMAVARAELRSLEASLYLLLQDDLLQDLTFQTNLALDFRADNGSDFPFASTGVNYSSAATYFYTYAANVASGAAFAGSQSSPSVTLADPGDLGGGRAVTQFVNDLAVLPERELGLAPLASATPLVGIEPWSQAGAAYAQLARENPWYFGYRSRFGGDEELARIIQDGERVVSFIEAIREADADGNSDLFGALIQTYRDAASRVQTEIDDAITEFLPAPFKNGAWRLNLWAGSPQSSLISVAGRISAFAPIEGRATQPVPVPPSAPGFGWNSLGADASSSQAALLQAVYLIDKADADDPDDVEVTFDHLDLLGDDDFRFDVEITGGRVRSNGFPRVSRLMYYEAYYRIDIIGVEFWLPYNDFSRAEHEAFFLDVWENTGLRDHFTSSGNSTSGPYNTNGLVFETEDHRIVLNGGSITEPIAESEVRPGLHRYRVRAREDLLSRLIDDPASDLYAAAEDLDRAVTILNAYLSIGMPKELDQSQVLRSAFRALPGTSELGLGAIDVIALIDQMGQADSPSAWADQSLNVTKIDDILHERIGVVGDEIRRGLAPDRAAATPGYVGWVLAELEHLQATALDLAVGDTYTAAGVLNTTAENGLLANDVDQPELSITVDQAFTTQPAHGTVTVNTDGSFTYQADPGFVGTDSFTYRSTAMIPDTIEPVYSNPATVVVMVEGGPCNAADFAAPFGLLDLADVVGFVGAFSAQSSEADLDASGVLDLADVVLFVQAFTSGCP